MGMSDSAWHTDVFPELRSGPPWVMEEMIAAQPALIEQLLQSPPPATDEIAGRIGETLQRNQPVVICGCGTSEHAAQAVAALIRGAALPGLAPLVRARPALSAVIDPSPLFDASNNGDYLTHPIICSGVRWVRIFPANSVVRV
jgi:hypothetical protein